MNTGIRNIDFEVLRGLRDRHGSSYPRGRVVFREGDTSAEFFVVLQGSVELSIRDKETGLKKVLWVAPPGDFFGEMSCFAGNPRSATAVVVEDNTVLLKFNQETAIQLLRASPRFALGVIQRLCDRVNGANKQIAELTAQVHGGQAQGGKEKPGTSAAAAAASQIAAAAASARPAAARPPRDVPPPDYDRGALWGKPQLCPVSNTRFVALNVHPEAFKVRSRESDFREVCQGVNPLWYVVHVCPDCLYAAYPEDFGAPSAEEAAALQAATDRRRALADGLEFNAERTLASALGSFRLAAECYSLRATDPHKLGGVYHRAAWLAREAGDASAEREWLAKALRQYGEAVESDRPPDPAAELTLIYTIGELHLRIGSPAEAVRWLSRASQHPEFRKQPEIARLTRDRWSDAREGSRARD